MNQQKTKYRIEKDMDSFKERVSMKEETTPKKLLSHKRAKSPQSTTETVIQKLQALPKFFKRLSRLLMGKRK
jgi:hypothetical protein